MQSRQPTGTDTSEESESEQIYPEEQIHNLLIRRNFPNNLIFYQFAVNNSTFVYWSRFKTQL